MKRLRILRLLNVTLHADLTDTSVNLIYQLCNIDNLPPSAELRRLGQYYARLKDIRAFNNITFLWKRVKDASF